MKGYLDIPAVPITSNTWKERKRSNLVKWLMRENLLTAEAVANKLEVSVEYLNNKLHRDSFTVDDIFKIAELANKVVCFVDRDTGKAYRLEF